MFRMSERGRCSVDYCGVTDQPVPGRVTSTIRDCPAVQDDGHEIDFTLQKDSDGRTRQYCSRHYMQIKRHGKLTPESERRSRTTGEKPAENAPTNQPLPSVPLPKFSDSEPTPAPSVPTPAPAPTPAPDVTDLVDDKTQRLLDMLKEIVGSDDRIDGLVADVNQIRVTNGIRDKSLRELTTEITDLKSRQGGSHTIKIVERDRTRETEVEGPLHPMVDKVTSVLAQTARCMHVWLHGESQCGKTTLALQVGKILTRELEGMGKISHESSLSGYVANLTTGEYLETPFYKAVKYGKLLLWDDADRSNPVALAWANMGIANGLVTFASGETVEVHPNFRLILTANTTGHGRSTTEVAEFQSISTRKRFIFLHMTYNEDLERSLVGNDIVAVDWVKRCHQIRKAMASTGVQLLTTTSDILNGLVLLKMGWSESDVLNATIFQDIESSQRNKVLDAANNGGF